MDLTVLTYLDYPGAGVPLTTRAARVPVKAGRVLRGSVFQGGEPMARAAVNRLLVVGFCLVDLGFTARRFRMTGSVVTVRDAFSALSVDVGTVLLVLGVMHLGNVFVRNRLRRRTIGGSGAPLGIATAPGSPGYPGPGPQG